MSGRLNRIQDWTALARQAKWSVANLAKLRGVSTRTLERHFLEVHGQKPKAWMNQQRQKLALELVRDGSTAKEAAHALDYQRPEHFSRDFKARWGYSPAGKPTAPPPPVTQRNRTDNWRR